MSISTVAETALPDSAIDSVAELQRRATRGTTFTNDREPGDVYFISKPDGSIERIVAEPKPLYDKLSTPQELAAYINDLSSRDLVPKDGIVRVFPDGVNFRFKFANGRDQAAVPLTKTPFFKAIEALAGANYQGSLLTQADLYRLLRVTLRGCLPDGSTLAAIIKDVTFDNGVTTSGTIDQTRKNLGIAIAGKVAGANSAAIPESFFVTLNVFENFVKPIQIEIDLDTVPDQNKFRLTPYPGQIERALRDTLSSIRDVFDSTTQSDSSTPLVAAYMAQ